MRYLTLFIILLYYLCDTQGQRLLPINDLEGPYNVSKILEYNGELIIGGSYWEIFGVDRPNIAAWNGSQIDSILPAFDQNTDRVRDMIEFNGNLIASGRESTYGHIAQWDGTSWNDMAGGFDNVVWALEVYNGELYAGGAFTMSNGDPIHHMAKWTGSDWVDVGIGLNNVVRDLEVHNGELYAVGDFTYDANTITALDYIAKWNGNNWAPVNGGLESYTFQLQTTSLGLLIIGSFESDKLNTVQIPGLALLDVNYQPVIHQGDTLADPGSIFIDPNGSIYISFLNETICLGNGLFEVLEVGRIRDVLFFQNETIVGGNFSHTSYIGFAGIGKLIKGVDHTQLGINGISATLRPDEMIFHDWPSGYPGFEAPAHSGTHSLFGSTTMMAGKSNGIVHGDPHHYHQRQSVGPIGNQQSEQFYQNYFQVWHLSSAMIDDHINSWSDPNYSIPNAILSWPGNGNVSNGEAALIAPFNDLDQDNIYEPLNGEFPLIRGDEAVYYIYHNQLDSGHYLLDDLLEAEIHVMLYGFHIPWYEPVHNTVFANFKVINRSNIVYDSTRLGIFSDLDIGNAEDDFIGCDPALDLYFAYNGDAFDEDGPLPGYGDKPPAQGVLFLNHQMDTHVQIKNDGTNWPNKFWNDLNGLDINGDPYIDTCNGYTHYMYPGDPVAGICWEENMAGNFPDDRRSLAAIPHQSFGPGDTICLDIAYVFAQDTAGDQLTSITLLKQYAQDVQDWYDQNTRGCTNFYGWVTAVEENEQQNSIELYPNPTGGMLTIEGQFHGKAELEIYSMSGRLVDEQTLNGHAEKSTVDLSALKNGIYLVVLRTEDQLYTERLIKLSY